MMKENVENIAKKRKLTIKEGLKKKKRENMKDSNHTKTNFEYL